MRNYGLAEIISGIGEGSGSVSGQDPSEPGSSGRSVLDGTQDLRCTPGSSLRFRLLPGRSAPLRARGIPKNSGLGWKVRPSIFIRSGLLWIHALGARFQGDKGGFSVLTLVSRMRRITPSSTELCILLDFSVSHGVPIPKRMKQITSIAQPF